MVNFCLRGLKLVIQHNIIRPNLLDYQYKELKKWHKIKRIVKVYDDVYIKIYNDKLIESKIIWDDEHGQEDLNEDIVYEVVMGVNIPSYHPRPTFYNLDYYNIISYLLRRGKAMLILRIVHMIINYDDLYSTIDESSINIENKNDDDDEIIENNNLYTKEDYEKRRNLFKHLFPRYNTLHIAYLSGNEQLIVLLNTFTKFLFPEIKEYWKKDLLFPISSSLSLSLLDCCIIGGNLSLIQTIKPNSFNINESNEITENTINGICAYSNLDILKLFHNNKYYNHLFTINCINEAAEHNNLNNLEFLHYNRNENCTKEAMDGAASNGYYNIVKFLYENRNEGCTKLAIINAAKLGHLNIIEYLWNTKYNIEKSSPKPLNLAAKYERFEVMKWLHNNNALCTKDALDSVCRNGNMKIIEFLTNYRNEGCRTNAIDYAARNGNLNIIEYLYKNKDHIHGVECTTNAIDKAAKFGYLNIIKWLNKHFNEGCTEDAMTFAAEFGYLDIVEWLHYNRNEGCHIYAIDLAAKNQHLEIIKFLYEKRNERCTTNALNFAIRTNNIYIVEFLCEYLDEWIDKRRGLGFANICGYRNIEEYLLGRI